MNAFMTRRLPFQILLLLSFAAASFAQQPAQEPQKVVQQGIAIEFTVDPSQSATKVRAGEDTNIKFKVTDTTTGTPVKGLNLSAWLSLREGEKARRCCAVSRENPIVPDGQHARASRRRSEFILHPCS